MFIRRRLSKNKSGFTETYRLIETYHEGGKVKQRTICNLGRDATLEEALENTRSLVNLYEELLNRSGDAGYLKRESIEETYLKLKTKQEKLESVMPQIRQLAGLRQTR